MRTMITLVAISLLTAPLAGCGGKSGLATTDSDASRSLTPCEKLCMVVRDDLINNFAIPPERVNCAETAWRGSCDYCFRRLKTEFVVQPEGPCPG